VVGGASSKAGEEDRCPSVLEGLLALTSEDGAVLDVNNTCTQPSLSNRSTLRHKHMVTHH